MSYEIGAPPLSFFSSRIFLSKLRVQRLSAVSSRLDTAAPINAFRCRRRCGKCYNVTFLHIVSGPGGLLKIAGDWGSYRNILLKWNFSVALFLCLLYA